LKIDLGISRIYIDDLLSFRIGTGLTQLVRIFNEYLVTGIFFSPSEFSFSGAGFGLDKPLNFGSNTRAHRAGI
jgi:hypothetical protein